MEGAIKNKPKKSGSNQTDPVFDIENQKAAAWPYNEQQWRRRQRLNSTLIAVVGIGSLVFGAAGFYIKLSNPFAELIQKQTADATVSDSTLTEAQKAIDTDGDGLSDYDETNKYKSSPYLADSNGDGIDDKTSIDRGIDPNCIPGQTCGANLTSGTAGSATVGAATATQLEANPTSATQTSVLQPGMTINASVIRAIMKQNGVSESDLSQISDSDLMSQFKLFLQQNPDLATQMTQNGFKISDAALSSANTPAATSSAATSSSDKFDLSSMGVNSVADLNNLTALQIRELMSKAGVPQTTLNGFTDDQLRSLFLAQLNSSAAKQSTSQ